MRKMPKSRAVYGEAPAATAGLTQADRPPMRQAAFDAQPLMKASRSGLTTSACVVQHAVREARIDLEGAVLQELDRAAARSRRSGTIWSSSPCMTSVGTVIAFRSSV